MHKFIRLLEAIYKAIEDVKDMKFTSSSVLMVYDSSKESTKEATIKLIDFENARESEEEDKDLLEGIENLCGTLRRIYDEA